MMALEVKEKEERKENKLYVIDSRCVPIAEEELQRGVAVLQQEITLEEARILVSGGFISAVRNEFNAELLSGILNTYVPCNKSAVFLHPGDIALLFILHDPARIDYTLVFAHVITPVRVNLEETIKEIEDKYKDFRKSMLDTSHQKRRKR
ncbi:MAG: hypothetical protein DSO07_10145 [Thermoproteota archaeon]|uniref:DUF1874 domain-containing protein n=1 Tax=Candidatus Methanodesulfokora washburnensis TaxID=2478471 RepID=A0A3R9R3B7_9CREN|nr:DUF1874 domain-containing protein [Candidatus Methanodesulfokores washburnensis]RSN78344.1 DUF1874 domain-containing protein [Candidatus Methanodesulfokores washburnensis]TDA39692.1 MAG: hypothetical protein DSO07_10145 [Candidatus Korarchaeota archaeon]